MAAHPKDAQDPEQTVDDDVRLLRERLEEKQAVIDRIKAHIAVWQHDKRMKVMGEVLLRQIERIEAEEHERTLREGRGRT